jgi:hypothetical protein
LITGDTPGVCTRIIWQQQLDGGAKAAIAIHHYLKRKAVFASAPSASSAAVTEACPATPGKQLSGLHVLDQGLHVLDQDGAPWSRVLLRMVLTRFPEWCLRPPSVRWGLGSDDIIRQLPRFGPSRKSDCEPPSLLAHALLPSRSGSRKTEDQPHAKDGSRRSAVTPWLGFGRAIYPAFRKN